MKPLQTSRAIGASAVASLLFCMMVGAPSVASAARDDVSDLVAVGKTGHRYVYKVRGLFVVASVGDVIAGCVVRSSGGLDCQGGGDGVSLEDIEGRPGVIAETLSQKNRMLQEQSQRLQALQAELDETRRLLNERPAATFPSGDAAFGSEPGFVPDQPVFDVEDDLNF